MQMVKSSKKIKAKRKRRRRTKHNKKVKEVKNLLCFKNLNPLTYKFLRKLGRKQYIEIKMVPLNSAHKKRKSRSVKRLLCRD